jgi:hypothetical protein
MEDRVKIMTELRDEAQERVSLKTSYDKLLNAMVKAQKSLPQFVELSRHALEAAANIESLADRKAAIDNALSKWQVLEQVKAAIAKAHPDDAKWAEGILNQALANTKLSIDQRVAVGQGLIKTLADKATARRAAAAEAARKRAAAIALFQQRRRFLDFMLLKATPEQAIRLTLGPGDPEEMLSKGLGPEDAIFLQGRSVKEADVQAHLQGLAQVGPWLGQIGTLKLTPEQIAYAAGAQDVGELAKLAADISSLAASPGGQAFLKSTGMTEDWSRLQAALKALSGATGSKAVPCDTEIKIQRTQLNAPTQR